MKECTDKYVFFPFQSKFVFARKLKFQQRRIQIFFRGNVTCTASGHGESVRRLVALY